jgi:hypothetical protein
MKWLFWWRKDKALKKAKTEEKKALPKLKDLKKQDKKFAAQGRKLKRLVRKK